MRHRHEIDGLRALAVAPVVLFHAGIAGFSGGYVGVDVFFVISGYLITALILRDLDAGRFSALDFYERRARRILPALLLVAFVSLPAAWLLMLHDEFRRFAESLAATALFASNIYFWLTNDYFSGLAEEKPLLHTWSLAIEEQFYIFFPLLLLPLWRRGRGPVWALLLGAAALSLLAAEWGWRDAPRSAFYLAPFRIWELLVGAACAVLLHDRAARPFRSDALAGAGLVLLLAPVALYDADTPFPGLYGLAPVLGTALVILFAPAEGRIGRLLRLPPLLGLGLISYSVYLWHQPLFAFARVAALEPPSPLAMGMLALAALGLSYLSWRYVERPFRDRAWLTRRRVFVWSGAGLGLAASLGVALHLANGLPGRFGYDATRIDREAEQRASWRLFLENPELAPRLAAFDPPDGRTRLLVMGDSHAKDLFNALYLNAPLFADRFDIRHARFVSPCLHRARQRSDRAAVIAECLAPLRASPLYREADTVLLSLRWRQKAALLGDLPALLAALQADGKAVAVAGNTPEFPDSVRAFRKVLAPRDGPRPKAEIDAFFHAHAAPEVDAVNAELRRLAEAAGVAFLDKRAYACDDAARRCHGASEALEALHYDYGHLTVAGAAFLGREIARLDWLAPLSPRPPEPRRIARARRPASAGGAAEAASRRL